MLARTVLKATHEDRDRVNACMITAFANDPFIRWMFPDAKQYLGAFPQVCTHFAGRGFDHNAAYRTEDYLAAAMWLPPGVHPDEEALGAVMEEWLEPSQQDAVFGVLEQVGEGHPEEDHWYLPSIGVDPICQGKGYGTALMARGLEVCDRDHVAAYLESTNVTNIPFYQNCGFEIIGEIQMDSSPVVTRMLRAAR